MAASTVIALDYQQDTLQDDSPFLLWHGGRGSGKSRTLVMDLYNCCVRFPMGKFALTCNDFEQLRDSTHQTLLDYLRFIQCPYKYSKRDKIMYLPNGSEIHELTLNKDKTSLKGPEWDGTFFDEADGKNTTEDKWDYLVDSTRGKIGDRRIRAACNPVTPGHFLGERFFVHPLKGHRGVKVSTYMNAVNLPPDYIPRMEARYKPGTKSHARWMLGDLVTLSGAIYPMFNEDYLIEPDEIPDSADALAYGQDLGFNDPHVLLEGRLGQNGILYISDEYYQAGLDINDHIPYLEKMYKGNAPIYSDHSATQHSIMAKAGFNMYKAYKDVHDGIQLVSTRFQMRGIRVSTRCVNLIKELYAYCWKDLPNSPREEPEHKYSHAPDALRYLIGGIDHDYGWDL